LKIEKCKLKIDKITGVSEPLRVGVATGPVFAPLARCL